MRLRKAAPGSSQPSPLAPGAALEPVHGGALGKVGQKGLVDMIVW